MNKKPVTTISPRWATLSGVFMILLGFVAIAVPFMMSIALELFLGWLLLFGGALQMVSAFNIRHKEGFFMQLLAGVLYFVVGGFMLFNPIKGAEIITIILAISFAVQAIMKIVAAVQLRPAKGWIWIMLNGVVTAVLAGVIFFSWPLDAMWVVGLLFGIKLLFIGWSVVMVATAASSK